MDFIFQKNILITLEIALLMNGEKMRNASRLLSLSTL